MPRWDEKILEPVDLAGIREQLAAEGKTVVQCHGCFDIVHPGHIRYLRFARERGDVLIVSLSGDDVVGKGYDRPYIHEQLRAENLAVLEFVDYVCVDHHTWAGPILEQLRPDIYIKGKEYEQKADPRFLRERELVESYGGKVIFSSGDVVYSSSFIIDAHSHRFPFQDEKVARFCTRHALTLDRLNATLQGAVGKRVLVVGDPILDHYVRCDAAEVASESPVLSVSPVAEDWFVGGAGLIALQLSALGLTCELLTAVEASGSEGFRARLDDMDVSLDAVTTDARPVYIKTRYLVDGKKVFKVNTGRRAPLSTVAAEALLSRLRERLPEVDALVVVDFGYGMFSERTAEAIAQAAEEAGRPWFVDVSGRTKANVLKFKRPTLATPTEDELRFALADRESGIAPLAARYYQQTGAEQLIVTLSERGVLLFHPPKEGEGRLHTDYLPALTRHPVDTVGAGDVFLAAQVLTHLAGEDTVLGLYLGSALAALHLGRLGNSPTDARELTGFLERRGELTP